MTGILFVVLKASSICIWTQLQYLSSNRQGSKKQKDVSQWKTVTLTSVDFMWNFCSGWDYFCSFFKKITQASQTKWLQAEVTFFRNVTILHIKKKLCYTGKYLFFVLFIYSHYYVLCCLFLYCMKHLIPWHQQPHKCGIPLKKKVHTQTSSVSSWNLLFRDCSWCNWGSWTIPVILLHAHVGSTPGFQTAPLLDF